MGTGTGLSDSTDVGIFHARCMSGEWGGSYDSHDFKMNVCYFVPLV